MKSHQPLLKADGPMGLLCDEQFPLIRNRKNSTVEQLMMQGAKRDTVLFNIRASGLMPLNMPASMPTRLWPSLKMFIEKLLSQLMNQLIVI